MKFEVFILGGQIIDQKRNKGWWRGSRERIEMEAQKVTELTIEEEDKEHLHLPLLVSSRQKLQNSKGYAKSPEFSPALGLIVFGEKSVATNLR